MAISRVLDWNNYTRINWRFVVQIWVDLAGEILRLVFFLTMIAAALRYLAT